MHVFFFLTRSLGFEALAAPTHTSFKCSSWTNLPDKKIGLRKESLEFLIGLNSTNNSCVRFLHKPIYLIIPSLPS